MKVEYEPSETVKYRDMPLYKQGKLFKIYRKPTKPTQYLTPTKPTQVPIEISKYKTEMHHYIINFLNVL